MRLLLVVAAAIAIAACSGAAGPIIDTQGVDMAKFEQDKAECATYAEQVSTGRAVGKGAAAGAAVGAAVGAIAGGSIGRSAGIGAVTTGAASANTASGEKSTVINNCLRNRGYKVLN